MSNPTPSGVHPMTPELKACPFCGGDAEVGQDFHARGPDRWIAYCRAANNCGMSVVETEAKLTREQAVEAWNRRASSSTREGTDADVPMEHITRFLVSLPKWIPVIAEVDRIEERKKFAVNWWGEINGQTNNLVAEVYDDGHIVFAGPTAHGSRTNCVEALVDIEPQLAALFPSALPSSRALSEEERRALIRARQSRDESSYAMARVLRSDLATLIALADRLTGAPK